MTKSFAVIGYPVKHSLSPALFTYLFAEYGLDASYVACEVAPEKLADHIAAMRAGDWDGLSVTVPHKLAVRSLADEEDPLVTRIGAANTLVRRGDRVAAYNTDAEGCRRAVAGQGADVSGKAVIVLGAGGAARSAVFAALDHGAQSVRIVNRTASRAEELARAAKDARCAAISADPNSLQAALNEADLLIQATTLGMGAPDVSPLPPSIILPASLTVFDMVYSPLNTALLRQAEAQGCPTIDGLWMLVYQALKQFELWTGEPVSDYAAILLRMELGTLLGENHKPEFPR
ncbi:MAG: shikimate dehydrogenase [Hyphomonadaceae bacterium]|nr:shikimate dehydrogenase [Hyphomonadaceae bacterium]